MKVYKKEIREIRVLDFDFKYLVVEENYRVILRIYSSINKDTYCELYFKWQDCHEIDIYRPMIVNLVIHFAIEKGWQFREKNQIFKEEMDDILVRKAKEICFQRK